MSTLEDRAHVVEFVLDRREARVQPLRNEFAGLTVQSIGEFFPVTPARILRVEKFGGGEGRGGTQDMERNNDSKLLKLQLDGVERDKKTHATN